MKKCKFCNSSHRVFLYKKQYPVCSKHRFQLRKHGKVFKRTKFDSNELFDMGEYCEINLYNKKGKVVGKVKFDHDDINAVKKYHWVLVKGYAFANNFVKGENKMIKMHRFLLNPNNNNFIDHINSDTLDNRKSNLRICDISQNNMNREKSKKTNNLYKGVHKQPHGRTWSATIFVKNKRIYLGNYPTAELAAASYNEAAKKYHGEFARLNIIQA